jgi:hypothetical protein
MVSIHLAEWILSLVTAPVKGETSCDLSIFIRVSQRVTLILWVLPGVVSSVTREYLVTPRVQPVL